MRVVLMALAFLMLAPTARADDRNVMRFVSHLYLDCAAFYQAVLDTDLLPRSATVAATREKLALATEVGIGAAIAGEVRPVRDPDAYGRRTQALVDDKARELAREYRSDPARARPLIARRFAECEEAMGRIRPR